MALSTTSRFAGPCASRACSTATRNKCDDWLKKPYDYPFQGELFMERCSFVEGSTLSKPGLTGAHEDKRASVILNVSNVIYLLFCSHYHVKCVGPSLPLLSTWVAVEVQEAFYSAFRAEQACQAGLMIQSSAVNGNHTHQHNIGLEYLILQAKMRRAQAEIELYTVAIANAREFDFSDDISGYADQQYGLRLLMALQVYRRIPMDLFRRLGKMNCVTTARTMTPIMTTPLTSKLSNAMSCPRPCLVAADDIY